MHTKFCRFLSNPCCGLTVRERFLRASQYRDAYGISIPTVATEMGLVGCFHLYAVENGDCQTTPPYLDRYLRAVDALVWQRQKKIHQLQEGAEKPYALAVR